MKTAHERLSEVRAALGFQKKADFAERVGIERSTYDKMEKGPHKPSADNLEKIATKFPAVNLNWILLGQGPMLYTDGVATPTPAPSPLHINTDGESESYWKALAADRLEQLRAATEREKWLQGQFQELVGKSPASAYTAVPVSAPVPRSIGFGQMWLAPAA